MDPKEQGIVTLVRDRMEAAKRLHSQYRDGWDEKYGLYRNFRKLQSNLSGTVENDRDVVMDAKREFGGMLFIPWIYATIETVLPKLAIDEMKMRVVANKPEAMDAVEPIKQRYDFDQNRISYELSLQSTARRGLIYGLGVQKTYWEVCYRNSRGMERSVEGDRWVPTDRRPRKVYEGPQAESVDQYDFFWDPAAHNIKTCEYVIHRIWRPFTYIKQMVEAGDWNEIDLEAVQGMGSETDRGAVWEERMRAAGLTKFDTRAGRLHEIWEYHDRERVYTVLDDQLLVQDKPNPAIHGDLPFQIFRPTIVPGEFVGLGEAEPITHLNYELNTLRSQRRDAATIALNRGYFYQEGSIEDNDLVMGAGVMTPVYGDPAEAIFPMPIADLPASGYQEEEAIKQDIERTSGVSDPATGSEATQGSAATATGMQLQQNVANRRIALKGSNLRVETVRPGAAQWRDLYRQHGRPETIRVPDPEAPEGYGFTEVGPDQYNADWEVIPEGGTDENQVQKRQDALQLFQSVAGVPEVDQRHAMLEFLKMYGAPQPEAWLTPPPEPNPTVDPEVLGGMLQQAGMDEQMAVQIIEAALSETQAAQQGGMPAENGAAPAPA
jgi:hypothetical protein